ncbi:MAG: NAD(P)/FAD-dependent oxidoreductase [Kofleriaceae bacterium]|nr:NAD(P)/FAD-dependent oxidoreductase [Kofleriaceae bacterium]MBP6837706.1 NAD(P)/FAD-dependent oxidoreductase [Kofleriaceae bacterium]MBP9206385.1 NAD(P)/FAD-dependent oxidoreductase [Kofleriaceae bacterium]
MTSPATRSFEVVIVGGGTGGLSVAARLAAVLPPGAIALVEPSDKHYYQPLWTLVGAGVVSKETTERDEADYVPDGVVWIRDKVAEFSPDTHQVVLAGGERIGYQHLVVALGIQLDWHKIDGVTEALGQGGVVSNYRYDLVDSTWRALRTLDEGNAVFTFPSTPVKCAGAPQKIMYLADEHLRRRGVRAKVPVIFASAGKAIFGVERYARSLRKVIERKQIETRFRNELVAVRPASREAVLRNLDDGTETSLRYGLLHVVPPQSAPDVIKRSPLAVADAAGWVDVDKYSLRHVRYPDVWSLGDCSSLPTSRTGAAIRKQAPVLVDNLLAVRAGREPIARYDGYASCPLVTGYGKLILAEFDYDGRPAESFPFDQSQERYSMWALKTYGLPEMYWNGMLRGRM